MTCLRVTTCCSPGLSCLCLYLFDRASGEDVRCMYVSIIRNSCRRKKIHWSPYNVDHKNSSQNKISARETWLKASEKYQARSTSFRNLRRAKVLDDFKNQTW